MEESKGCGLRATIIGIKDSKGETIKQTVSSVEIPIHQVVSKLMKDTNRYLYVDHITNNNMKPDEIRGLKLKVSFKNDEYRFYLVNKDGEIELEFE